MWYEDSFSCSPFKSFERSETLKVQQRLFFCKKLAPRPPTQRANRCHQGLNPPRKRSPKSIWFSRRREGRAHFADAGNGAAERRASKQHHGRWWALRCTSSPMPQKVFELGRRRRRKRLSVDYDRPKIPSKTGVSCVQYFYYVRCFSVCELLRCTRFPYICITLSESPPRHSLHSACYAALKYSTRAILPPLPSP